jgi:3'-phosphoadenosine 5'-phosphosulfate (PAPS) 3'-phosphatase
LLLHFCKKVNNIFGDVKQGKFKPEVFSKGANDKFTSVDWIIQKLLEDYLNIHFPKLKFVGEEDTTNKDFLKSDYLTTENINFNFDENLIGQENRELNIDDLCLFVDPIDSTSQFIKGNFEPVTTLIGLTNKGMPLFGIIHFPSYQNKEPLCYLNFPGNGVYQYDFEKFEKVSSGKSTSMNFISSNTRTSKDMLSGICTLIFSFRSV